MKVRCLSSPSKIAAVQFGLHSQQWYAVFTSDVHLADSSNGNNDLRLAG
jgi:hypothetical protein